MFHAFRRDEDRADIFAVEDLFQDPFFSAVCDPERFTGAVQDLGSFQLAGHAADGEVAVIGPGRHVVLLLGYALNHADAVAEGAVFIGLEQSVHGGQDHGQVGAGHGAHEGGEGVVVAELEFIHGYRVVFVEDRQHVLGEQRFNTVFQVEMPFPGAQVVCRQQQLGGVKAPFLTFRLIKGHEFDLSDRRQRLNFRKVGRSLFQFQHLHCRADGTGGDKDDLSARAADPRDLVHQLRDRLRICQQTGPRLDDDPVTACDQVFA